MVGYKPFFLGQCPHLRNTNEKELECAMSVWYFFIYFYFFLLMLFIHINFSSSLMSADRYRFVRSEIPLCSFSYHSRFICKIPLEMIIDMPPFKCFTFIFKLLRKLKLIQWILSNTNHDLL